MVNTVELGNRLRQAIIDAGLTVAEVSRRSGRPRQTIDLIVRGQMSPGVAVLDDIAKAAGTTVGALIDEAAEKAS